MQELRGARAVSAPTADPVHRLARYLSIIGHPFIVIPASLYAIGVLGGGDVRAAGALAGLFVAVSVGILLGIKAGRFNDFDVSERQRRPGFYALVIGGTVALGFWLRGDPVALRTCAVAGVLLIVCGLVNRWTKVSLHTAFALYAIGLWGVWSVTAGIMALPVAAAVAWSRVHLGRHSWREVFAGALIGAVAGACLIGFAIVGA